MIKEIDISEDRFRVLKMDWDNDSQQYIYRPPYLRLTEIKEGNIYGFCGGFVWISQDGKIKKTPYANTRNFEVIIRDMLQSGMTIDDAFSAALLMKS